MIKFIELYSLNTVAHLINVNHIVEISQFKTNETFIHLSNKETIITGLSKDDVFSLIKE